MSRPIISVIVPTFRPENYLSDCLMSLSKQDCSNDLFEVIIILNGEKNPYFDFIQDILNKIDQTFDFQLFYTIDKGVSKARNFGLDKSNGEYITFLDDDDFVSPNYLSGLSETLLKQSNPDSNSTIVCSNLITFDGIIYGEDYIGKAFKKCASSNFNIVKYRQFLSGIAGKLIPKKLIGNIQFNTQLSIGEDSVFLFELSKNISKMILTRKEVYYVRRIRKGSASTSKKKKRKLFSNFIKQTTAYTKIYFKAFFRYNFILYLTRMFASVRQFFIGLTRKT